MQEMKVLADIWQTDLQDVSDDDLRAAIQKHRRTSEFFPTIAELFKIMAEWGRERERQQRYLPEDTGPSEITEEQAAENLQRVRRLLAGMTI